MASKLMEPISASQAMEWSIELEKSLRPKRRAQLCNTIDAISKLEGRLVQWSLEPEITFPVRNMFGLFPGEERLFANAVLLRVVDAFIFGDKQIRLSVTKLFLLELKARGFSNRKQYNGLLSKMRVQNPSELINRVRTVFDSGNVDDKAMALTILGCWADFAIDSPHVRYIILSSLISNDITEVMASLFAAGCFCELSDDFSYVMLEMIINLISSSDVLITFKIIGARSFSKFNSSYSVADKAFEAGLKLALDSPEEKLIEAFLLSLSKLALKWFVLIPRQAEFLLHFLGDKNSMLTNSTSLRGLKLLFSSGHHFTLGERAVSMLLSIADDSSFPAKTQCYALVILQKLLQTKEPCLSSNGTPEFEKLLDILKTSSASTSMEKRFLSINILVVMMTKGMENSEMNCAKMSPPEVVDLVITNFRDRYCENFMKFKYVEDFLGQIVRLVKVETSLAKTVMEKLISMCINTGHCNDLFGEMLILAVRKVLVLLIDVLNENGAIDRQAFELIIQLADSVISCQSYKAYVKVVFSALSHCQLLWNISGFEDKILGILSERENSTLTLVRNMVNEMDNWCSFKAGKCAALCGSWKAAVLIFEHLASEVHSHIYVCWLNMISQYSHSESNIHLLNFYTVNDSSFMRPEQVLLLDKARNYMCSSFETLETASSVDALLIFQKWFLSVRAKFLGIMADLVKNLNDVCLNQNETGKVYFNLHHVMGKAEKLKHLADEFDLICVSFIGIDLGSKKIISALALICSILAFAASFALFIPSIEGEELLQCRDRGYLKGLVTKNLLARLPNSYQDIRRKLYRLLENLEQSIYPSFGNRTGHAGNLMGNAILVLDYVVSGVIEIRDGGDNMGNGGENMENGLQAIVRGFQMLLTTILQMIRIPIQLPLYFFKVRRCVGAELFMLNTDNKNMKDLMVYEGSKLSVNVCVQLRNFRPDWIPSVEKLCSIVTTKSSFLNKESEKYWVSGETDILIEMNKKLMDYAINDRIVRDKTSGVSECMTMEVHNKWQSFSSSLLDVSAFPVGSYIIKWLCCCVDANGTYWTLLPLNDAPSFTVLARTA